MTDRFDRDAIATEAAQYLSAYLRFDTTNSPGIETPASRYLAEVLQREGIPSEVVEAGPGRGNVVARLKGNGSKRPLLLLSHEDVVPAVAADWSFPPFGGELRGGYVCGRGAIDCKGVGIVQLVTMLLLKRMNTPLARDVIFAATAGEEPPDFGLGARYVRDRFAKEWNLEYCITEGGQVNVELPNVHRPLFMIETADKGVLQIDVTATGKATHPSLGAGDNAAERLARALVKILDLPEPEINHPAVEELQVRLASAMGLSREALRARLLAELPTKRWLIDPVVLKGYHNQANLTILPSESAARIVVILAPSNSSAELIERYRRAVSDPAVRIERVGAFDGNSSEHRTELFGAIESVAKDEGALAVPYVGPATDSVVFREAGVTSYGFSGFTFRPADRGGVHGVDERLSIENLGLAVRRILTVVTRLCAAGQ